MKTTDKVGGLPGFTTADADRWPSSTVCQSLVGQKGFEWLTPEIEAQMKESASLTVDIEIALRDNDTKRLRELQGELHDYKVKYPNWETFQKECWEKEQKAMGETT